MNISAFYNKYPYPNTQIQSISELNKLTFQKNLLKVIQKYIKKGKVLEIGSGTGEMSLLLSSRKFAVTATDISNKSLEIAKESSKKLDLNIKFKYMDILDPKTHEVFDVTLANGVLHHTQNPKMGFKNMVKLTKKHGLITLILYTNIGLLIRKILGKLVPYNLFKLIFVDKTKSVIYDAFYNPQETAFSKKEILTWFKDENIKFREYKNFGNVFLMVGEKN